MNTLLALGSILIASSVQGEVFELSLTRVQNNRFHLRFTHPKASIQEPCLLIVDRLVLVAPDEANPDEKGHIEMDAIPVDQQSCGLAINGSGELLLTSGKNLPDLRSGSYQIRINGMSQGYLMIAENDMYLTR